MSKPTIALVPGAWHSPIHYETFLQHLRDADYPTVSKSLPSVGSLDPKSQTVAADANFIRQNVLLPEIDQGKDVILIMHSYGGCPGAAAAKGLSKAERVAAGQQGGIVGLIFLCAFLALEGDSMRSKLPGQQLHPWNIVHEETGQIDVENPEDVFYNTVIAPLVQPAVKQLKQQALAAFISPSPPPAWTDEVFNGRRAYVKCHEDHAIPYIAQDMMVSLSGLDWQVLSLEDAGHSPFLTRVDTVGKFVDERAREWANAN
ncbi:hypothetical protein G7046_g2660 [Stylonectria norvegica]|nr:hypothetical protein G7046_g2660 [Stylonectria norvegica]